MDYIQELKQIKSRLCQLEREVVVYVPTSSTDNVYPIGTLALGPTFIYFRAPDGIWVKAEWQPFY